MRALRRYALLLFAALFLLWLLLPSTGPRVADGSVLVLELSGSYTESSAPSLLGRLLGSQRRPFVSVLSELEKARRDERLSGVLLRIRRMSIHWGMAEELRDAIRAIGESGKPTLAYLETGGLGSNLEYYVATAADELVISPGTTSPIIGLAAQFLFLGGLWEKAGAGFDAVVAGEYKSAAESIAGTAMSEAHREMATSLLDSTFAQFVAGIAEGRNLDEAVVRQAVDAAPVDAEALTGLGLIDAVLSFDQAVESMGAERPVILGKDYENVDPSTVGFDPVARFALVYGSGAVVMGEGASSPTGDSVLASDSVSKALEQAAADPDIAAIVFRVDSPGGSPLASEIVWRAVEQARAAGKPFVASVSNMAASGGYYVLCGADAIVAPAGSLIGSIGAFALRPHIGGLLEKLGIGVESLTRGSYADLLLFSRPLDADGRERLREEIWSVYDLFVERVAAGRGMSVKDVDAAGRGRVFTGAQALELGLIDELGGLRTALARAKLAAGLEPDADVALIPYPPARSLAEQVSEALQQLSIRALPRLPMPDAVRQLEALLYALPLGRPLLVAPYVVDIR